MAAHLCGCSTTGDGVITGLYQIVDHIQGVSRNLESFGCVHCAPPCLVSTWPARSSAQLDAPRFSALSTAAVTSRLPRGGNLRRVWHLATKCCSLRTLNYQPCDAAALGRGGVLIARAVLVPSVLELGDSRGALDSECLCAWYAALRDVAWSCRCAAGVVCMCWNARSCVLRGG